MIRSIRTGLAAFAVSGEIVNRRRTRFDSVSTAWTRRERALRAWR